jgi:DNA polymerase III delta prime subunit
MNAASLERRLIPIALAVIAAGFLAVWLARYLAGASLLLALALWGAAWAGLTYSSGGLLWADRHPTLSRLLNLYAPPLVAREGAIPDYVFDKPGRPAPPVSPTKTVPLRVDISRLIGIREIQGELDAIAEERGLLTRSGAPAVFILLAGPSGTGKTELARYLASRLHETGVAKTGTLTMISEAETAGLGDDPAALAEKIRKSVDGVLLLDGLDDVLTEKDTRHIYDVRGMSTVGISVLTLARQYPRRLIVIWTGSAEAAAALDTRGRWLGKLEQRYVSVPHLSPKTRQALATRLFEDRGFLCSEDAVPEMRRRLGDELDEEVPNCDNAYAVQRYVNSAIEVQKMRLRREEREARERGNLLPLDERSLIRRSDLEDASPRVTR